MSDDTPFAHVLQHRRVHTGKVLDLDVDEVVEPGGVQGIREVVRQRGSVAALPVFDDSRVVLVRQYRYAVNALVWELPAGRRDAGESPEQAAQREMEEEVGLHAARLEHLLTFWTTPGFCDEHMRLYVATGVAHGEAATEDDEEIELVRWPIDEIGDRLGEIEDAKTLAGLLLYLKQR